MVAIRVYAAPGDITPASKAFVGYSGVGGKIKATQYNDTLKFVGVATNQATKTITVSTGSIGAAPLTGIGTSGSWPISVTGSAGATTGIITPTTVSIPASGTYTFPAVTSSLWGRIIVGANANNADFNMDAAGNVQILQMDSSGLILSNSNLSSHLCIGNSVAANPVILYNRTASSLSVLITGFYQ